jgi:hypothetical protein
MDKKAKKEEKRLRKLDKSKTQPDETPVTGEVDAGSQL